MPNTDLFAAALSQVLRHELSGCRRARHQAVELLDRLLGLPGLDAETRELCEEKLRRLADSEGRACA